MTEVWFVTPVIVTGEIVELEPSANMPEPVAFASACARPDSAKVGLPETPLPFVTPMPLPLVASVRAAIVLGAVLTITPLEADSSDAEVPFNAMV
jgi:hypothetical protein